MSVRWWFPRRPWEGACLGSTIMIRDVSMVAFSEPEALKQEVSANRQGRGAADAEVEAGRTFFSETTGAALPVQWEGG